VDSNIESNIFAVCPITQFAEANGVDRCIGIDSSRYFVLRIQNAQGRHMFIGLAFNERNVAFDFNKERVRSGEINGKWRVFDEQWAKCGLQDEGR
jgi:hypothetical protein